MVRGLISLDQNKPEQAIYHFEESNIMSINFPYLDFYLGYSHYLLGNADKAKATWKRLIMK
ncbi:hypothetical protein BHF71_00035 [Vulcanibacillus modesticaldus]|uniref:Tetratricopeptide repeat protein n=1 Tax=Vulcanibacillus modesticaldus TaxID=337097 RepID=A0A1D2YX45_9BACI|nr:hypothetical protein BHF71_00035 [Vulcanibacillus modesticaldus]